MSDGRGIDYKVMRTAWKAACRKANEATFDRYRLLLPNASYRSERRKCKDS